MIIEFINFWWCYWIAAYGPFIGNMMLVGTILAGTGLWVKLAFPWKL